MMNAQTFEDYLRGQVAKGKYEIAVIPAHIALGIADYIEKNRSKNMTPCDVCRYNPPSSMDGKPCTMCPAERKVD